MSYNNINRRTSLEPSGGGTNSSEVNTPRPPQPNHSEAKPKPTPSLPRSTTNPKASTSTSTVSTYCTPSNPFKSSSNGTHSNPFSSSVLVSSSKPFQPSDFTCSTKNPGLLSTSSNPFSLSVPASSSTPVSSAKKLNLTGTSQVMYHPTFLGDPVRLDRRDAFQNIVCMEPYKDWSADELRLMDYNQGHKYGPAFKTDVLSFGSTNSVFKTPAQNTNTGIFNVSGNGSAVTSSSQPASSISIQTTDKESSVSDDTGRRPQSGNQKDRGVNIREPRHRHGGRATAIRRSRPPDRRQLGRGQIRDERINRISRDGSATRSEPNLKNSTRHFNGT